MTEEAWHPARLIPTAGIKGEQEQERRATSALLAVMGAVPEFGHALIGELGAPAGRISTFAEVRLKDANGVLFIPDGVISVERGKRRWRCLVEVKTGPQQLKPEQVSAYLDRAREQGFDCVLTITNEITARAEDVPVAIDRRKVKRVDLRHLSWWKIITAAVLQHRFRGVSDPDQAWILGELIAYLDHENSGASGFQDMGESWVAVRDGAKSGTLRSSDPNVRTVAERWEQFVDYLALGLSQDLGRDVTPLRARRMEYQDRLDQLVSQLSEQGVLGGEIRVPGAIGPVSVEADLRARQVTTSVTVAAPDSGKPLTRINWLLRQLAEGSDDLRVDVSFQSVRGSTSALLSQARDTPSRLLSTDPRREPRFMTVAMARPLGSKRGRGQGSFVAETRRQLVEFYREVVQDLRAWQPRPPRLPEPPTSVPSTPQPEPPPFTAPEGREIGEAVAPESEMLTSATPSPKND